MSAGRLRRCVPLLVFAGLLAVYLANGRILAEADTAPARYLPFSIIRRATFRLDGLPGFDVPYFHAVRRTPRGVVSDYPVGAPLLALPVYAPFVLAGAAPDGSWPGRLEKLSAALITSTAALFMFLTLRRLMPGDDVAALGLTLVYGLGTTALSINAQALWQHTAVGLALAAAVYCLVRGRAERVWTARAALPLTFAVMSRPPVMFVVLPLMAYAVLWRGAGPFRFTVWALPVVAFHVWYSLTYFNVPLRAQFPIVGAGLFTTPLDEGLYGLLLSPGRGLLIYSSIFALSVVGAVLAWRRGGDGLLRALSLGVVPLVVFYARSMFWMGGLGYGPRLLGDLGVSLTLLVVPVIPWMRRARGALAVAIALVVVSVWSHAWGAFMWGGYDDARIFEHLWLWRRHPMAEAVWGPATEPARPPEPFFLDPRPVSGRDVSVRVALDAPRVKHEQFLVATLTAANTREHPLDLYAGLIAPGPMVVFFAAREQMTTPVPGARREWFRRLVTLLPGERVEDFSLIRTMVHYHVDPGSTFIVFAALVEPGSGPWRLVAADVAPVVVE